MRFSGSGVFGVARIWLLFGLLLCLGPTSVRGQEPEPVVHAVLFYSPTCPHCHEVITKFLIPLQNEYGRKLVIMGLDTSQKWANELFWEALRYYNVPEDRWAVPFMIVDDRILVGGDEIPANLPTIIDEGLASGGIDLPNFPALIDFMAKQNLLDKRYPNRRIALQAAPESSQETEPPVQGQDSVEASGQVRPAPDSAPATPEDSVSATPEDSVSSAAGQEGQEPGAPGAGADSAEAAGPSSGEARPSPPETAETAETGELGSPEEPRELAPESGADSATGPLGLQDAANRLESMTMMDRFSQDPAGNSFSVLVLFAMILSLGLTGFPGRVRRAPWPVWVIPLLVILGVGVASYLSFVEVTQVEAVCGPVGDCNTVNQSQYATLFGFLPVGVLGLLGYGVILLLWSIGRWGPEGGRDRAKLGLWGAAVFGVLFSIYLTFLEPFVIGATCAWCLSSAVIMTLLLWASAPHAAEAWPGKAQGGTRD